MATQTGMAKITDGDRLDEGYFNEVGLETMNMALSNHIKQLINRAGVYSANGVDLYGDAYVDADGRNDSVKTSHCGAIFDTNQYEAFNTDEVYVVIEATSLTETDFSINNCVCSRFDTGKWVLYCTTGTDAVKRAQIYKTLFYGSNGSDARATTTYITGITALKTNVTRDVGKKGYYAQIGSTDATTAIPYDDKGQLIYTGTFSDVTTNDDFSSWSYIQGATLDGGTIGAGALGSWYAPAATVLHTNSTGDSTSDETGTDLEADENDNPTDCKLYAWWGDQQDADQEAWLVRTYLLCAGSVSFAETTTGDTPPAHLTDTGATIDFTSTHNVPIMTAVTAGEVASIITASIPTGTFSSTISSSVGVSVIVDWETGANIQYKLINTSSDTGWLDTGEISNFTAFSSEPTTSIVRLVPKTTAATTSYPSIKGFSVRAV